MMTFSQPKKKRFMMTQQMKCRERRNQKENSLNLMIFTIGYFSQIEGKNGKQ